MVKPGLDRADYGLAYLLEICGPRASSHRQLDCSICMPLKHRYRQEERERGGKRNRREREEKEREIKGGLWISVTKVKSSRNREMKRETTVSACELQLLIESNAVF